MYIRHNWSHNGGFVHQAWEILFIDAETQNILSCCVRNGWYKNNINFISIKSEIQTLFLLHVKLGLHYTEISLLKDTV